MVHDASMAHGPSMVHSRSMVHGPSSIHGPGRGCLDVEANRKDSFNAFEGLIGIGTPVCSIALSGSLPQKIISGLK